MKCVRLLLPVVCCLAALGEQPRAVAILEQRCAACHSGKTKQSGLDLSSRELALRGGDRGPAIVPGNSRESLLYRVLAHSVKPHMPFQAPKLENSELAAIAEWIDAGALWEILVQARADKENTDRQDHWAFQNPKSLSAPAVRNQAWVRNPIDAFIAAGHEKRSLTPMAEGDKRTLLRRVYLDLIGLPPTREELERFLADTTAGAYENTVDRLLADPRYGERWGRHWMDVWRYSDWYGWRKGNDVRNSHKFLWRWRDWIVESLNEDKGYDRMIVEMIAGDEVAPGDPGTVRATGYLARNYAKYDRDGWMQDAVDHTTMAFLGVTVKCARCHDHKYDGISQEDYYRFRAIFEPYEVRIDRVRGEPDTDKNGLSRVFDAALDRPTYLLIRGDVQNPDKSHVLTPASPPLLGGALGTIEPVTLPIEAFYPDHRPFVHEDLLAKAKADIERADAELRKQSEALAAVEQELANSALKAGFDKLRTARDKLSLAEKALAAAKAHLPALEARIAADRARYAEPPDPKYEELADAARKAERAAGILKAAENVFRAQMDFEEAMKPSEEGKPGAPSDKKIAEAQKKLAAAQAALKQMPEGYTHVGTVYPNKSTGRRTALARWIASKENPLTARVAINHMWLRHFGAPLVPTVFDFGKNGRPPSHPELLDWLATKFMDSGWSMKAIHRLMVTSATYRMRSTSGETQHANAKADPENQYLWRMNPRRMEAEAVRDSILYVAGQLDPAMGGPEIDETKGFESRRRSIYFSHSPDTQMEFLKMFDAPNPVECYVRNESVVPQQALALVNSELSEKQARALADRLSGQAGDFAGLAFETILGRPPSADERTAAERFLAAQSEPRARAGLAHVLFNHNDFVTIR